MVEIDGCLIAACTIVLLHVAAAHKLPANGEGERLCSFFRSKNEKTNTQGKKPLSLRERSLLRNQSRLMI
jgi:hypothetical protein